MTNKTGNTGLKVALGIAIALFIGTGIFSSSLYKDKVNTENELTAEKNSLLEGLNAKNAQLEVAINDKTAVTDELLDAKERVQGLIDSLKVADKNVRSLWKYKKKFLSLQKEMDVLLTENNQLKLEKRMLASTLDSTNIILDEHKTFTDSLLVQNTSLASVVEAAGGLSTVNLKAFGVIERTSGKLIPTERAKRSDKIRVCFTVAKNRLAEVGDKELYVQVIDPSNNILGANEQIQFGEESLNYSVISKFNYENKNLDICEFVTRNGESDFVTGRYSINVFNGKELVSSSEFTLR